MSNITEETQSKKKKFLIIILGVVSILVIILAIFLLSGNESETKEAPPEQEVVLPIIYVSIDKPFIFNVTGDKRQRIVQVKVQLMVRGADNETLAIENLPLVEHSLLSAFSAATVEQLRTSQGLLEIREYAAELVKIAMVEVTGQPVVERVLFTGFVMQ